MDPRFCIDIVYVSQHLGMSYAVCRSWLIWGFCLSKVVVQPLQIFIQTVDFYLWKGDGYSRFEFCFSWGGKCLKRIIIFYLKEYWKEKRTLFIFIIKKPFNKGLYKSYWFLPWQFLYFLPLPHVQCTTVLFVLSVLIVLIVFGIF